MGLESVFQNDQNVEIDAYDSPENKVQVNLRESAIDEEQSSKINTPKYSCSYCDQNFSKKSEYKRHTCDRKTIESYFCYLCNKK